MEYSMILILRVQSSFPRTGTNCETGKTPILFRLVLLTVRQPEEFCYPAGLVAALHFSLVSKLRLNISPHCCDTTEVSKGNSSGNCREFHCIWNTWKEIINISVLGLFS